MMTKTAVSAFSARSSTSESQASPADSTGDRAPEDAMPRLGLPLVHFNETHCGRVAELRSLIVKARRLARNDADRDQAAATVKSWLLAQIEQKRAAPTSDIVETASDETSAPNARRPASARSSRNPAKAVQCRVFADPTPRGL